MGYLLTLLAWLAKLTKWDLDDDIVIVLKDFFRANPGQASRVFKVVRQGIKNGFDLDDKQFVTELTEVFFAVLETQMPQEPVDLGSNKL